ncbi:hypothetical protein Poly51_11990 [Rubripirellula tenax]|uniref:Uncharacterized protein n=1 Tax=Rubripirellula tenax TaxID=2528015 RepID=A0A5C6FFP8_9BACT|nr:hypothetical protein [Rubripirellula tenax]TWU58421.1 hypothetical protein Poly51_11990 [Rubripirellula tenax]
MFADIVETLISPETALWLVVSVMAGLVLLGTLNRRRSRLTETLKDFVERTQEASAPPTQESDDSKSD